MCPVHIETAPLRAEQCGAKYILFLCTATDLWCIKMNEMYVDISIKSKEKEAQSVMCVGLKGV